MDTKKIKKQLESSQRKMADLQNQLSTLNKESPANKPEVAQVQAEKKEQLFNVVFEGKPLPGIPLKNAIDNFARISKKKQEDITHLFDDRPKIIKRKVNKKTAMQYHQALKNAGIACRITHSDSPLVADKAKESSEFVQHHQHISDIPKSTNGEKQIKGKITTDKESCPNCGEKISITDETCKHCKKQLEVTVWHIKKKSGETFTYTHPQAIENIKEGLISGKLKLTFQCKQTTKRLIYVEGENDHWETEEKKWETLRDYTDRYFPLQVLYNASTVYGRLGAIIGWIFGAIIITIWWNAGFLMQCGARILAAISLTVLLLLFTPTVIGLLIVAFIVSTIYDINNTVGVALRTLLSIGIGIIGGAIAGAIPCYILGYIFGLSKKKQIRA
ncbi:MAG: zinc ribbon domain-containing protein [Desulfobacteraceae bacterium]|jgi:hypothetical protein